DDHPARPEVRAFHRRTLRETRREQGDEQMDDLSFDVELCWSQAGAHGAGALQTNDLTLEISGPASMGGLGVGASPEELLVSAVSSCYAGTFFGVLRGA